MSTWRNGDECDCTRCRKGEPLCYRNTPEAVAKIEAREDRSHWRSEPESLFHRLYPDPVTVDSLAEIIKDHYPSDGFVAWEGTYRQKLMLDSLTKYAWRLRRVTGKRRRSRTEIAESLGMRRAPPISYSNRPLFALMPKYPLIPRTHA